MQWIPRQPLKLLGPMVLKRKQKLTLLVEVVVRCLLV